MMYQFFVYLEIETKIIGMINMIKKISINIFILLFTNSCLHSNEKLEDKKIYSIINSISNKERINSSLSLSLICKKYGENIEKNFFLGSMKKDEIKLPNPNTIYQIGSISKIFLSALTLKIIEKEKIHLHSKISDYLNNLPIAWNNVTVVELLTMTSGIPSYFGQLNKSHNIFINAFLLNPYQLHDKHEILKTVSKEELVLNYGQNWYYSNTNYLLLGIILEKVTNKKLSELMQDEIFRPLNLKNTFFIEHLINNEIPAAKMEFLAEGYDYSLPLWQAVDSGKFSLSLAWASGSIISTAHDIRLFINAFFNKNSGLFKKLITYNIYKSNMIDISNYHFSSSHAFIKYSLGFFLNKLQDKEVYEIFHSGSTFGFNSFFYIIPEKNISYVLLTDSMKKENILELQDKLNKYVYENCL